MCDRKPSEGLKLRIGMISCIFLKEDTGFFVEGRPSETSLEVGRPGRRLDDALLD